MVDDDSRGAIITWLHSTGSYPYDTSVHAHHVLANGSFDPNWTPDGLDVATAPKSKGHPQLAKDGAGGAWFVWVDGRSDRPDIYAEHVTHDGQIAPPVGVPPSGTPATLALSRGFPNPTRRQVTFTLSLPEDGHVLARVLDVAGRVVARVANEPMTAGAHSLTWNGNGEDGIAAPAGIYVFEIRSGGRVTSGRVVRL